MEKREINHHGTFTPFFTTQNSCRCCLSVLDYLCKISYKGSSSSCKEKGTAWLCTAILIYGTAS